MKDQEKQARLAAALRDNLKKRKAAARPSAEQAEGEGQRDRNRDDQS